ncbi:MAG TPA: PEP-CTERM sorting domain-containing protein [Candidatus Paceibacterota bacterium]|nr:PEP-CTERM sorting domain-containing protein [Verrucomicrobiota bacterium]HRY47750.1 PEP-CTERM sorting domain-containing protein [Candidatus Paceibacterota bacterium]HSA02110.1 PEP-CTERM sorting domain-containing protein [Candidatus Paceibacterota bacterium]
MKHALLKMILLGITGWDCFGGAAILANNYDANNPVYTYPGIIAPVEDTWLQFCTATGAPIGAAFGLVEPGFFDHGFFEVPGAVDNADVIFVLRGWHGTTSPYSMDSPRLRSEALISQKAGSNPGAPTPPSPTPLAMPSDFVLWVPEPSTTTLAVLGAGVLLWIGRRK